MISQTGSLGETLRTAVGFKVLQGVTIGSALPMLIDIVLDKSFKISNIDITRLSLPQFVSTISAAIYLLTNDQYYTTYLFTCFLGMKMLVPSSLIFYSLSQGAIASKFNLRQWVFLLPILFTAIARVIISYSLLFPEYTILLTLVTMCFIIGSISFFLVLAYWLYSFWRQYRVDSVLGLAETEELSYALGLVLFFFCYVAVSLTFNTQKNWLNTTETVLISLNLIQTILVVWLTVLPGRLLRKVAEVNDSLLRLKREFVRYVSHEIRSPLNVACAGLEILKADLEALRVAGSILDLLNDINFLELALTPLKNLFASRLETYKYMSSKKDIALHIEDLAQASEYYSPAVEDGAGKRFE
eukprot:gene31853-41335_t